MADSIYTYVNQTTLLNKNTFTLSLATCYHYCLSRKMPLSDDTCMWFTHNVREITPSIVLSLLSKICVKLLLNGDEFALESAFPFDLKLVVDGIPGYTLTHSKVYLSPAVKTLCVTQNGELNVRFIFTGNAKLWLITIIWKRRIFIQNMHQECTIFINLQGRLLCMTLKCKAYIFFKIENVNDSSKCNLVGW